MSAPASQQPRRNPHQRLWAWSLAGALLGALGAGICFAPALWLQRAVLSASDGRLVLQDSQGTVWHGSAQLGLRGGPDSKDASRLPGRVQWQLRPYWGGIALQLQASCCTPQPLQLRLRPGLQHWRLDLAASQSSWPAALLTGLGTPWNTVQLQGSLQLSTSGLELEAALDRLQLQGSLQMDLPDMASRLSTLRPLGSYRLQLQGGEQASLQLQTMQGSLQLQGQGRWSAGHLRFEGQAWAEPGHEPELNNLLNIMGRRDGARSVITLG